MGPTYEAHTGRAAADSVQFRPSVVLLAKATCHFSEERGARLLFHSLSALSLYLVSRGAREASPYRVTKRYNALYDRFSLFLILFSRFMRARYALFPFHSNSCSIDNVALSRPFVSRDRITCWHTRSAAFASTEPPRSTTMADRNTQPAIIAAR